MPREQETVPFEARDRALRLQKNPLGMSFCFFVVSISAASAVPSVSTKSFPFLIVRWLSWTNSCGLANLVKHFCQKPQTNHSTGLDGLYLTAGSVTQLLDEEGRSTVQGQESRESLCSLAFSCKWRENIPTLPAQPSPAIKNIPLTPIIRLSMFLF